MSGALWIKSGNSLVPADPVTEELLAGIKQGTYVHTDTPPQPRNPKHHRLMMAILSKVVEHTWPRFADVDGLIWWLKLRSGMFKTVHIIDGVEKFEMESIKFHHMGETKFKAVKEKWLNIICTELMPGTDPEELVRAT